MCYFVSIDPKCPIGMQYSECTKSCSTTCHSLNIQEVCKEECVDGCTCPGNLTSTAPSFTPCLCVFTCNSWLCVWHCVSVGKVLDGNRCVEVSQCSCVHMGRHFPPGSTISQDCNTWWQYKHRNAYICSKMLNAPSLNGLFSAVSAVMVPGNAPIKAALVGEIYSSGQCAPV